jgi:hypothetical protein
MARRRIRAAKITHISLVPRGANRMPVIFKADDQTLDLDMLVKADMEKGELTAIVYAPETRDTQGDIASAEVIKDMMYEAARDGVQIDMRHDGAALKSNQAFVAESFIVQKGDPRFDGITDYDGNAVDPEGSWGAVIKVDDPVLRQKYRDGEWNGVSMGGTAEVVSEKSDDMIEKVCGALAKALGVESDSDTNGEIDMKPEELDAALTKSNESLAKSIVEGVKAVVAEIVPTKKAATTEGDGDKKKEPVKKSGPKAPIFKGNPLNPDDIMAHQRRLAVHTLTKDTDWGDSESVSEYMEKLAEFQQEFGEFTEAEVAAVSGKPATRPGTNQPVSTKKGDEAGTYEGVSKEDQDLAKIGADMAKWCNRERGFEPAATE